MKGFLTSISKWLMVLLMIGSLMQPGVLVEVKGALANNWIDFANTDWYGDGSASTFTITNAAALAGFAKIVNGVDTTPSSFAGKTIILGDDIDLDGKQWTPIGSSSNRFRGIFDGNEHTISSLTISNFGNNAGFFGYIDNAQVLNLSLENVEINNTNPGTENTAGLVAVLRNSTISQVSVSGTVIGLRYTGGLFGNAITTSSIRNSSTNVNVEGTQEVGGLGGIHSSGMIEASFAIGEVRGVNSVGGLLGRNSAQVIDSYSKSAVYGNRVVGGLVGHNINSAEVINSYSKGNIQ